MSMFTEATQLAFHSHSCLCIIWSNDVLQWQTQLVWISLAGTKVTLGKHGTPLWAANVSRCHIASHWPQDSVCVTYAVFCTETRRLGSSGCVERQLVMVLLILADLPFNTSTLDLRKSICSPGLHLPLESLCLPHLLPLATKGHEEAEE